MEYRFKIRRFNPEIDEKPHWEQYTANLEASDRVLDGLEYIKGYHDGTLAFRRSCAHGVCGSDAMLINGRTRLACKLLVKEAIQEGDPITVDVMRGFSQIKDMIVDMRLFFEKYRSIRPYLINDSPPEGEFIQTDAERERIDDTSNCILCGACSGSCPTYWADKRYVSPAIIVQAHRFIFDSRDQATQERLKQMEEEGGVFTCRSIYNCSEACPRNIEVVKAINEVRQAIFHGKR